MDVPIIYTVEEIAEITNGKIIQQNSKTQPSHLLLDSRKLLFPQSTLFFAINSSHRKGSGFIKGLYEKDVQCFVTDDTQFDPSSCPNATFILVDNVLQALHLLAIYNRSTFALPVIGVTGSNGKTIVKEWLYQLLESAHTIVRSPKSYNSQIGVPLSVLQISQQHSLAIFEAGISEPGEMDKLEKIIHPSTGVFTNIGDAHSEGFENKDHKIREKLELFRHSDSLIFCSDDGVVSEAVNVLKQTNRQLQLFTWGDNVSASLQLTTVTKEGSSSLIKAKCQRKIIQIRIPFTDNASIQNAIACWCVLLQMKMADSSNC